MRKLKGDNFNSKLATLNYLKDLSIKFVITVPVQFSSEWKAVLRNIAML